MSINKVIISGNLTRDPEVRVTATGMPILSLGIAVNDRRKNSQTGEWEDYPNFIDCTMFGTRADKVSTYLSKGMKVTIEGKLRWSQWEHEGKKRSKIDVVIDNIDFAGNKKSDSYEPSNQQSNIEDYMAPATSTIDTTSIYDDDLPF